MQLGGRIERLAIITIFPTIQNFETIIFSHAYHSKKA